MLRIINMRNVSSYITQGKGWSLVIMAGIIMLITAPVSAQDELIPYTQEIEGSDVGIEMIPIKGGTFMMGSSSEDPDHDKDEEPVHEVEVSPFWMGKFEVTWDQYELFMNSEKMESEGDTEGTSEVDAISRPSKTYFDPSLGMGKDGYPAISMTYYAAQSFAKWLTLKTGFFYRLPTEAEWEYACRAGTSTAYPSGDDKKKNLKEYAWYRDNSDEKYHKAGTKESNPWGLFNMLGNAAEWTMDQYYEDYYSKGAGKKVQDPWADPQKLHPITVRGGSWDHTADKLRCASRIPSNPRRWKRHDPQIPKSLWWNTNTPFLGFRLVRPLNQPSKKEMEKFWDKALDQFSRE